VFELKFTKADAVRSAWSFAAGVIGYLALSQHAIENGTADWKALAAGAVVAGLISIKNLVLKDGTTLKG
jgi:hypothetical protein